MSEEFNNLNTQQNDVYGTKENPYIITDIATFISINENLGAFYKLSCDIDMTGRTWTPIGNTSTPFTGGLDGAGYAIKNLKVNTATEGGLFGRISEAEIRNLGFENGTVTLTSSSGKYAGMLAAYAYGGSVSGCYSKNGTVSGYDYLGGLLGYASGTEVTNCYATGSVKSTGNSYYVGGLAGYLRGGNIDDCYAAVRVSSGGRGLAYVYYGTVTNSWYDNIVADITLSDSYNIGKLTAALVRKAFFTKWDFENIWNIEEGISYPYLQVTGKEGETVDTDAVSEGAGTKEIPYLINSAKGLGLIKYDLAGYYRLSGDIDMTGIAWESIGSAPAPFTGGLDGAGHAIKNLKVNTATEGGLFGRISEAEIRNLGFENGTVTLTSSSGEYAGMLAAYAYGGSVSGCYSINVAVNGNGYLGGLFGYISGTEINNCYATGNVKSMANSEYVGGLIGFLREGNIRNCYAAVKVSSGGKGLIYWRSGTVTDSWYDSIVADITLGDIYNVGKLTTALMMRTFFATWDFENVWNIREGISYPYLQVTGKEGEKVDTGALEGGDGKKETPYLISSAAGLGVIKYDYEGNYRLSGDIDMNGIEWIPIEMFSGGLDGAGHVIKNLRVNIASNGGLFKRIHESEIRDLGFENGVVTLTNSSGNYAGMLAANTNGGSVSGCYSINGEITGNGYLGGLLGYVSGTEIVNCYATGSVKSVRIVSYVGGLAGYLQRGKISNCYVATEVSSSGSGLVYVRSGTVTDSWYDCMVSDMTPSDSSNIGKLTAALVRKTFFTNWDFENIWNIKEGVSYPYLRVTGKEGETVEAGAVSEGTGTKETPYLISSAAGLGLMRYELAGYYRLFGDIDMTGIEWNPIGNTSTPFTGGLDGAGYAIKNLKVNTYSYAGMFTYVQNAKYSNLKIENGEITATSTYAGALAARMVNCTVDGIVLTGVIVSGREKVGILTGLANGGHFADCMIKNNSSVTGASDVGGLIGEINGNEAEIKECCVDAQVTGTSNVGGLIGQSAGKIENCYTECTVSSTSNSSAVGGLVGYSPSNTSISNCYAACRISSNGNGLVYGSANIQSSYFDSELAGKITPTNQARTTEQMQCKETFVDWNWETIWDYSENDYPRIINMKEINKNGFELTLERLTYSSAMVKWDTITNAEEFEVYYLNKIVNVTVPEILVEDLFPNTSYTIRVCAKIGDALRIWSQEFTFNLKKTLTVDGIHVTEKGSNSIKIAWNPVEDACGYEVLYDNRTKKTDSNECILDGLLSEKSYVITVKAFFADGSVLTSKSIIEKLYALNPKTDYAAEFIRKCENQTWFIDEIESILNLKGKSIKNVNTKADFDNVFYINLSNRGISGKIPVAIGELSQIRYLYLSNNDLYGSVPEEIKQLDKLIEKNLSGNTFS